MKTGNNVTDGMDNETVFQDRGYTNDEIKPEYDDSQKKHSLVVSLFSMLQRPSASVITPSFGERTV